MSAIFGEKPPSPIPVVNPADVANRANDALVRRLASGGTNADIVGGMNQVAPPVQRPSTLTGIG